MSYTATTWVEGITDVGPTNLNHLETGVVNAAATADAAIPAPVGPASNDGLVWNGSTWVAAKLVNANIDAAAAIDYSKLSLAGSIVNNDMSTSAAIAISKLANPGTGKVIGSSGGSAAAITPSWSQICDSTLGSAAASFDTNTILGGNIPAIYNHLRLVLYSRGDTAAVTMNPAMRFNNDSGANYDFQGNVQNNGAITANAASTSQTLMTLGYAPAASATAAYFGCITVDIPNYTNTVGIKAFTSAFSAVTSTAAAGLWNGQYGGAWISTVAVNRITVSPSAGNFVAGSRFTLYGLL